MQAFRDYDELFPELVYDIVDYFRNVKRDKQIKDRSVFDYCLNSRFNKSFQQGGIIEPDVVHRICETLVQKRVISCIRTGIGSNGKDANYLYCPHDHGYFNKKDPTLLFLLNSMAYGFRYIYSKYREYVLPVVVKKNDKITIGTCFRFRDGIVTAKHCLEADQVFISQYTAEKLNQFPVIVSSDPTIDMAYIHLEESVPLIADEVKVLDEVLVMGYPRIPMFLDFCTVERATVSSVIPTRGSVASMADQYISPKAGPLMLITARVRGGNSGGPVIAQNGAVVGVAFSEPMSQGDYDEMGYGVAYPIGVLDQILKNHETLRVNFVDGM